MTCQVQWGRSIIGNSVGRWKGQRVECSRTIFGEGEGDENKNI